MKHSHCIACHQNKLKVLEKYSKTYLVQCKSCKLVFSQQIPTIEELNNYYKVYAYDHDNYSQLTEQRYLDLLKSFEKYRVSNTILDVGCGNGFFLEVAQKQGWKVYGTEFSEKAVEILKEKGIDGKLGALDLANYSGGMFDVITSLEVLEHINNPVEELSKFNKLLRVGGLLYATTPNFSSLSRLLLKENWNIITYPEHLTYYTKTSLSGMLVNTGFRKLVFNTTGFSMSRFYLSRQVSSKENLPNTENTKELKNTDEKIRYRMSKKGLFSLLVITANFLLNLLKMGDTLKIYYVKSK
ncbi:MAG: class I SAM-dependent methyltransferase [Salinivirgaceae bacterium]|jgi:2-polyprenyl-3-methyl-5-hydroxy-6-metoxy-1,4-benzoquinol methylase|nr:class I SAM-dependent methyltransferase [Salinivirgaceae bacterium]